MRKQTQKERNIFKIFKRYFKGPVFWTINDTNKRTEPDENKLNKCNT